MPIKTINDGEVLAWSAALQQYVPTPPEGDGRGDATALPAPTGLTAVVNNDRVRVEWNAVSEASGALLKHYILYSNVGLTTEIWRGNQTFFERLLTAGVTSYPFYLVAVSLRDVPSAAATVTATVTAVPDVTDFTATWDGLDAILNWTEVSNVQNRIIGYRLYDAANAFLGFAKQPPFFYRPTGSPVTLKIKAVDAVGNLSANFASFTLTIAAPAAPTAATVTYDGGETLVVAWTPSVSVGVAGNRIRDGAGTLLVDVVENFWRTRPFPGVENYTFRIYARNRANIYSTTYAEVLYTMPRPAPPASLTATWDGNNIVWEWPASVTPGVNEYELTDSAGAVAFFIGNALKFKQQPSYGVSSYSYRIYARRNGLRSSTFASLTFTLDVPLPPAGATAAFDGQNVVVTLTPSPSTGVRHYTAKTVAGVVIEDDLGLVFRQRVTPGTSTYTFRFFATTYAGIESTAYREITFTVPVPAEPTGYDFIFTGLTLEHGWAKQDDVAFELWS